MRSHDRRLEIALKTRERKPLSSQDKSNRSYARSRWTRIATSRGKRRRSSDSERLSRRLDRCSTVDDANESNIIACDIIELFCENDDASHVALEERTICPSISSSTELEKEDAINVCSTCKNCAECQLRDDVATGIREETGKLMTSGDRTDEELVEHFDYYEGDADETTSSTFVSVIEHEAPILVDLTSEESKAVWKQTILKRLDDAEDSEVRTEPRTMIADSSIRLQRGSTGGSLATALRDRGPCVIPVQPNRSLPIRPAPPMPTRSTSIVTSRKTRSPILKLSNPMSLDVVELQSEKSLSGALTNEINEFPFRQRGGKSDGMMLADELIDRSDYVLPDMNNVVQITQEVTNVKRKNCEDQDREYEKEITKDMKKRRKSHEVDASHMRDERVENILKEYSRTCSASLVDKGERSSQHMVLRLWDDKRCSPSVVVSTTESETEKTKEICNKVVPPLRLKKIVREASTTNEYRNVEVSAESRNESNYRIVTGATPRPESPSGYSTTFWSSVSAEGEEIDAPIVREKSRRLTLKSDGYKIKYRRNRLRQKLRELRGKALELSREMAARDNNADTSPQCTTRLRQMMNCYEKQIENVSKLLCKLSASIPPASTDDVIVELDYDENQPEDEHADERRATDIDSDNVTQVANGTLSKPATASVSRSPSPEPPKLSPRSPIDYEKNKSPNSGMRNSPPVLPRVYIAIQPTSLERPKQNVGTIKSWHAGDASSNSSLIEKGVSMNDSDERIIHEDVTNDSAVSPVSSSEFEGPAESGTAEWSVEASSKMSSSKNPEIKEKITEDTKTFNNAEVRRRTTSPISSNVFLGSTINIEIDNGDAKDTKELPAVTRRLDDIVAQASETSAVDKQAICEKQEPEQSRPKETLLTDPSILVVANRKPTEYTAYDSEKRVNDNGRMVASTIAQETSAMTGRSQAPASNVTNILQLQSNYYGSSVARDNAVFTGVIQNPKSTQKVTSSVNKSVALEPTMPRTFTQPRPTVSSSNQQCVVLPNSCNSEAVQENTCQRNDGNRIMTEQFPTLGNWVARMSKKQSAKSKSKLQSGVALPTASTAEVARIPGLEAQKVRASAPNTTRNNIVNVAPQWNTERWQRQHQQRQQLYAAASSAAPIVRPGICPPISVTQFYPPNYTIDPYGGNGAAAFGYHSAMCPYGDYPYHSRLHATAPQISGYQIPLQDPHHASTLRQMQHLDKRFPHLQETTARHHFAADLLKYPAALSAASSYQHTAAGLEFERLRTATSTQNGTSAAPPAACLPPLLLPPPPPLQAAAQQTTLTRTAPLAGYSPNNAQCGRNRMIPDVVAAAAAAAVVAAASFGRQRGPLPPYERTDTDLMPGGISGVMNNESAQLMTNRATSRERNLPEQVQSVAGSVNVDSRLNNGGYRQLQNLILDRLPYVKTDDAYAQPATLFSDSAQEAVASTVSSSTYTSKTPVSTSGTLIPKESMSRKDGRNCDTPHLGKVNRTLDTTNNLECSNCGLTGSMFKCLGCETAFYCDERCQTRHWSIHVEKCPKRMPKLKKLV